MSVAGGSLQSGGPPRTSTTRSKILEGLGTQPSMRRALARLGAGLGAAEGPASPLLAQHQSAGGLFNTTGLLGVSARHRLLGGSGGGGGGSWVLAPPLAATGRAGGAGASQLDRKLLEQKRLQGEAARLRKDYDNPDPRLEWPDFFWAAEGYATKQPLRAAPPDDVLIVDTPEVARAVVDRLISAADTPYPGAANRTNPPVPCRYFACDTEVAFIDVTSETPVRLKPHHPILAEFKRFFEHAGVKKVWHNYGFDRHVLENMGIAAAGFGGDTLHMARLADASRSGKKTYGLDSLTSDRDVSGGVWDGGGGGTWLGSSPGAKAEALVRDMVRAKLGMKERFGMYRLRGDGPAKVPELPPIHRLHDHPRFRPTWIDYSALDAKATWQLREALEAKLRAERVSSSSCTCGTSTAPIGWTLVRELLTEMERRGMMVNREHLRQAQGGEGGEGGGGLGGEEEEIREDHHNTSTLCCIAYRTLPLRFAFLVLNPNYETDKAAGIK
eukprot:XP_001696028.1 PolI-like DNA polymerase [Chlamydomonas reinhardtii]